MACYCPKLYPEKALIFDLVEDLLVVSVVFVSGGLDWRELSGHQEEVLVWIVLVDVRVLFGAHLDVSCCD